jgi:nucleoredoxin
MRHLVFAFLATATAFCSLRARPLPLTTKEVTLMLRSGFSSETVQKELAARHFAVSCDAAVEKALRDAGAREALIDAIKSGAYTSSPADAKAAQEELAAQTAKRVRETERLRRFDTLYQDQLARERAAARARGEIPHVLADQFKDDLVSWKNGNQARFDDEPLAKKKLIALYFSAHWCAPCRKFTPKLVEFYNRVAPQHPEFEIVFVSYDRSPTNMQGYMRDAQMPWPAIDFARLPAKETLKKYSGGEIPCLVLVDATGKVVSDTYSGKQYVGPEKVLADLNSFLAKTPPAAIAASR